MTFVATQALNDAMLSGGIDGILDVDPVNPAYAIVYDAGAVALVTLTFSRPAATVIDHKLVFHQEDVAGDMIIAQGEAATFDLFNGVGTALGTGDVTDMLGTGAMKISGTLGTLLYEGARAIVGEFYFA